MADAELTSASFYRFLGEHRLMGSRCTACQQLYLPPRSLCPDCHGDAMEWIELSGRGRLLAYTTIHIAPTAMIEAGYGRQNPYCAGIVQLAEGPAISAQILGVDATQPDRIAVGSLLQASFVERGEGDSRCTYLAFAPEVE